MLNRSRKEFFRENRKPGKSRIEEMETAVKGKGMGSGNGKSKGCIKILSLIWTFIFLKALSIFSSSLEPKAHMVSLWDGIELGSMWLLSLTLSNFYHGGQWLNHDQILNKFAWGEEGGS